MAAHVARVAPGSLDPRSCRHYRHAAHVARVTPGSVDLRSCWQHRHAAHVARVAPGSLDLRSCRDTLIIYCIARYLKQQCIRSLSIYIILIKFKSLSVCLSVCFETPPALFNKIRITNDTSKEFLSPEKYFTRIVLKLRPFCRPHYPNI